MGDVISLAEWKAKHQRKVWFLYPVERDPTWPFGWRFEWVEAELVEVLATPFD